MLKYLKATSSNLGPRAAGSAGIVGFGSKCEKGGGNTTTLWHNGVLVGLLFFGMLGLLPTVSIAQQSKERVLHSFNEDSNGNEPFGAVTFLNGSLYGTTLYYGGNNEPGVIFKLSASGAETLLHTFGGANDGANPRGNLLDVNGTLYGTTELGGVNCFDGQTCGTVFSITPQGVEHVIYSFKSFSDAALPDGGLIDVNGILYGTSSIGGTTGHGNGYGTVYSVTTAGAENVLYKFKGGSDGYLPGGNLIYYKGAFYGTTAEGGGSPACTLGCGTVFKLTTAGVETVIHAFGFGTDGNTPQCTLVELAGTFYGTTAEGGAHGYGAVFSITPDGSEKVVYSFKNGADAAYPYAGLSAVGGVLYGTTTEGGGTSCQGVGCGTIFKISTAGEETVVYKFTHAGSQGAQPYSRLTLHGKWLYGTTFGGGAYNFGTVFKVQP